MEDGFGALDGRSRTRGRKTTEVPPPASGEFSGSSDYDAWRERYLGWAQSSEDNKRQRKGRYRDNDVGFDEWFPTLRSWKWRRTLSYWIAVTSVAFLLVQGPVKGGKGLDEGYRIYKAL